MIVNYRTAELTDRCLSLAAEAAGSLSLERVVVDNASGDGSAAYLRERHPDVAVAEQPENGGFAAGVNAGFEATTAEFVVLLNPDTEPQPGALARLVDHMRRNPGAGVAAPLLLHPDGAVQRSAHRRFPNPLTVFVDFCVPAGYALTHKPELHPHELSERETERGGPVEHVNGSALAIRRAAYESAGAFDEGFFMYLEETEWQERVRRNGWSIEVVPQARVIHLLRGGEGLSAITDRYVPSVYRYLGMHGHSERSVDLVLAVASGLSRLALTAIARLSPSRRKASLELRAFHRSVSDHVRARRRSDEARLRQ